MAWKSLTGKLLIIPPILAGAVILWLAAAARKPPAQAPEREVARAVRVITVHPQTVMPRLVGFGTVKPENVWTGVAQVAGRVVYVHPAFRRGAMLPADTEIARIAPDDYKLAIAEAEAQIRSAQAALAQLDVTQKNTADLLQIEEQSLALKEKTIEAKRKLLDRGNVAQLSFDAELRDQLLQKKRVQDLRNALRLLPTQKAVQTEQIQVSKSKLEIARLNLKRTSIKLPFAARISSVTVEISQFVQPGTKIGTADGVATAEVTANYPIEQLRQFFDALRSESGAPPTDWRDRDKFVRDIGLFALVRLKTGRRDFEWRGRIARLNDSLNEQTRTIGLIAVVDGPYAKAIPGVRPPLIKGMFVEVELRANKLADRIVVPRSALDQGQVAVVDANSRLVRRAVVTGYVGDDFAVIESGLNAGDKVVVSDLGRAVPGLLLKPIEDDDLQKRLTGAALGTGGSE